MHDHPHDHHHDHDRDQDRTGNGPSHFAQEPGPGPGHNQPRAVTQWQVRHETKDPIPPPDSERDLDLVESSFVEGFGRTSDPTSFLRLAAIPFVGVDGAGRRLHLLRVEMNSLTDVGAVSPLIGGEGVHYDPLPARMVSQRRRLEFVYHDGRELVRLDFAQARTLRDDSAPSHFALTQ